MPTLNIKDPEVHALAQELAHETKQSLTQTVKGALQESLARRRSGRGAGREDARRVVDRVMRIGRAVAALPVLDSRAAEEIIGYNEFGVPE